jgi:hypothetical protein
VLKHRTRLLTALATGALISLGYPLLDLVLACRDPLSEACVWGKAYVALTLCLSAVFVGGAVFAGVYVGLPSWDQRPRRNSPPGPPQHAHQIQQDEPGRGVSEP